eukprot:1053902-Amorphochlora_amoeboformis.AAC.1
MDKEEEFKAEINALEEKLAELEGKRKEKEESHKALQDSLEVFPTANTIFLSNSASRFREYTRIQC